MRRPGELWGRRTAAVGLVLVALAAAGAGVLLATGDDDDQDSPSTSTASVDPAALAKERLAQKVGNEGDGISARIPKGWTQKEASGLITLESGDHCVSVALSAPAGAAGAGGLLDDAVSSVRRSFKHVQEQKGGAQRVGGLDGDAVVLQVRTPQGDPVRVLITVGKGKQHAYLTQVVLRDPNCGQSLVDSQLVVNSIEYSK